MSNSSDFVIQGCMLVTHVLGRNALKNKFFDTYLYAKKFKEQYSWDNVKLEYLSEKFGIEQQDAHRAWCDAEANVWVYFKLKDM